MPTNQTGSYNYGNEFLDTGINTIPPVNPNIPDPDLTSNQNFSIDNFFSQMESNINRDNPWINSARFDTPVNTRLKDTLRYDDPEFGFDAYNPNIEYQYGDRQGFLKKWGNNLVKFGANTVGSFVESIATIPLVANAAIEGDLSKIENNSLTNGITKWLDDLENSLPNYETTFGKEHPVLNYIPFIGNSGDSWGGVLKNLGYTVGAIGGALLQDVAVGAVTGGLGEIPLIASQFTKLTGKLGKVLGSSDEAIKGFQTALNGGRDIEKILNGMSAQARILDKTRYGLSLLTSATAEGMFEANQAMNITQKELLTDFYNTHGYDATGQELAEIQDYAKSAGNATLLSNVALLTLTNGLQLETILKPSSIAKGILESKIDDGLRIGLQKGSLDVLEAIPDVKKGFRGMLSSAAKNRTVKSFGTESFEEGSQFVIQTASEDFYKRKYDEPSISSLDNFTSSVSQGLKDVFTTREGLENILIGGLSGAVISAGRYGIETYKGVNSDANKQRRLANTIDILNNNPVTGLFNDKYNAAVNSYNIANQMAEKAAEGDTYGYLNEQFNQLYNFVDAGIKTNRFEAQIERLQDIKDLPEKDQRSLLNIQDPTFTKAQLDARVDAMISKAYDIKKDIDKINDVFRNPYNSRTNPEEYEIYENYKTSLAHTLSKVKDNRGRAASIGNNIREYMPNVNTDKLVNLTSERGIKQTISELKERIRNLKTDQELFSGKEKTRAANEEKFIEDKISQLESALKFDVDSHYEAAYDLINYYNNQAITPQDHEIDTLDVIKGFNDAQDIEILNQDVRILKTDYNKLVNREGFDKIAKDTRAAKAALKAASTPANPIQEIQTQEIDENGNPVTTVTPVSTPASTSKVQGKVQTQPEEEKPFDPDEIDAQMAQESQSQTLKGQLKNLKKEMKDAISMAGIGPTGTLSAAETQANIEKIKADYEARIADLEKQIADLKAASKPAKEPKTPTPKVESVTKNNKKYNFNPIRFFTKVFTRDFKEVNGQNENINLRDFAIEKDAKYIYDNMTISAQNSTTGMKFGEYKKLTEYPDIYYTGYKIDFQILVDNKPVGKIQPSDRLFFKKDGKYIPLTDLTESDYERVTGNTKDTYQDFVDDMTSYSDLYKSLEKDFNGGKINFSNSDIKTLFNIGLTYGNIKYADNSVTSTLLKNVTYENNGNVVLSLPMENGERATQPAIIGKEKLSPEEYQTLLNYLTDNIEKIRNLNSRYVFLVKQPNGVYGNTAPIVARPAVTSDESLNELFKLIKSNPETQVQADKINQKLREEFYIANSSNTKGSGTKIYFAVGTEGKLYLDVLNNSVTYTEGGNQKTGFRRRILVNDATKKQTLSEVLTRVNETLRFMEGRLKGLSILNLNIQKENIKVGILPDESATFDSLKDSLSIAVKPDQNGKTKIFENPTLNIIPLNTKKRTTSIQPKPTQTVSVLGKKADIERRRKEELNSFKVGDRINRHDSSGKFQDTVEVSEVRDNQIRFKQNDGTFINKAKNQLNSDAKLNTQPSYRVMNFDKINTKYDAELAVLEKQSVNKTVPKQTNTVSDVMIELKNLENQELGFLNMASRSTKEGGQFIAKIGDVEYKGKTKAELKANINKDFEQKRQELKGNTTPPVAAPTPTETKLSTESAKSFLTDKDAKQKARKEADSQSLDDINNDFLNSLGCKP